MPVPFPHAYLAEAAFAVQRPAGEVFRHHLRLQGPESIGFRFGDEPFQQGCSDPLSLRVGTDIDADLSDTGGASCIGDRSQCGPAGQGACIGTGDEAAQGQVPRIPRIPAGRGCREGGETGGEPFRIYGADLCPVTSLHPVDGEAQTVRHPQ